MALRAGFRLRVTGSTTTVPGSTSPCNDTVPLVSYMDRQRKSDRHAHFDVILDPELVGRLTDTKVLLVGGGCNWYKVRPSLLFTTKPTFLTLLCVQSKAVS